MELPARTPRLDEQEAQQRRAAKPQAPRGGQRHVGDGHSSLQVLLPGRPECGTVRKRSSGDSSATTGSPSAVGYVPLHYKIPFLCRDRGPQRPRRQSLRCCAWAPLGGVGGVLGCVGDHAECAGADEDRLAGLRRHVVVAGGAEGVVLGGRDGAGGSGSYGGGDEVHRPGVSARLHARRGRPPRRLPGWRRKPARQCSSCP